MDYQNLLPFDEYLERLFVPALSECSRVAGIDWLTATLRLFEAIRWLELGIDLRVYSWTQGKALIEEAHPALAEPYKRFPSELHYVVPELTWTHLRRVVEKKELSKEHSFETSRKISMQFQAMVSLVAIFNSDETANSFTSGLLFLTQHDWEGVLANPVPAELIVTALAGGSKFWLDGHRASIYAGFFPMIKHLERVLAAFDYLNRPEDEDAGGWSVLRQAIRDIHGWRFDTRNAVFSDRFSKLAAILAEDMGRELQTIGVAIDPLGFSHYIRDLISRWDGLATPVFRNAAEY